jgi:ATP-dependent RNA helicase DeaD
VQSLAEEFDALDIAAAAVKLAAEATFGDGVADESDIPHFDERADTSSAGRTRWGAGHDRPQAQREDKRKPRQCKNVEWQGSAKTPRAAGPSNSEQPRDGHAPPKRRTGAMTRLIVKVGDQRNVRPKDLVGAITNEANIAGDAIGAIQIGDQSCVVEVQEALAEKVLRALSRTTIKGQRVTARRERDR